MSAIHVPVDNEGLDESFALLQFCKLVRSTEDVIHTRYFSRPGLSCRITWIQLKQLFMFLSQKID